MLLSIALLSLALALTPAAGAGALPRRAAAPAADGVAFVDNAVCGECHRSEIEAWKRSDHARAMQVAAPDTVLGDFSNTSFTHAGTSTRFFRKGGGYYARTAGADGKSVDLPVLYTFGIEPLQQYLVPLRGGRLQALNVAWDTQRRRWFDLYPDLSPAPGDPLHWSSRFHNWNARCADCHSTDLEKAYQPETDSYATTWAEIDVSCQQCHGPGARHVAWARAAAGAAERKSADMGLLVRYPSADSRFEIDTCAPCHSRRHRITAENHYGRPYLDGFEPENLDAGLYYPDGQILDEVYVYGSFLQSLMYRRGVRCSDCHDPHTLELRAAGNALCTRCHGSAPPARFPGMPRKTYDSPRITFTRPAPPAPCASTATCRRGPT